MSFGVTIRGGVKVPHRKNNRKSLTEEMPVPNRIALSMQQHIGATCIPSVKVNDIVKVGQIIGNSDLKVSAPVHSSVSGKVCEIKNIVLSGGRHAPAVIIEPDGRQSIFEGIEPPVINGKNDFLKAIRASGLVGLGGAGFPTHVKLDIPQDYPVDTLIINAAECEPYITTDNRECIENAEGIFHGIGLVLKYLEIPYCIIAIEDNKPLAISALQNCLDIQSEKIKSAVKISVMSADYPKGAEKVIIYKALGRKVPVGGFPYNAGVLVLNVQTVSFISSYINTGIPLIYKRITVDGKAINKPGNVKVLIGSIIKDIVEFCGGYKKPPAKILLGGPMMGLAVSSDDMPIFKQNNAVLVFSRKEAYIPAQQACIRCGRCVLACPMSLMPTEMVRLHKLGIYDELKKLNIASCMECGSCAYSCPAGRSLVQVIRLAKAEIRNNDQIKKIRGGKTNG